MLCPGNTPAQLIYLMTTTRRANTLTSPLLRLAARWLCLGAALCLASLLHAAEPAKKPFDVPAGAAEGALKKFSEQSGVRVVFPTDGVSGIRTNAVQGEFVASDALTRMLDGTNLVAVRDPKTGALAVNRAASPKTVRATPTAPSVRPSQAERTPVLAAVPTQTTAATPLQAVKMEGFEVLGSRIRQTDVEGPSPVLVFDQKYLLTSGLATTEEFLRTLPQNFTGASAGRAGAVNDENPLLFARNAGQSGVSLRGLGSNSTLVLINGRRAPLSGRGNNGTTPPQGFFDINTVPLGMIERIEVLTDGASAIYGTDAVGGVVNIILKQAYNATEVRYRVGGTYHGGGFERGATLTHGITKDHWKLTAVIDWFNREPLWASQRWFSKSGNHTPRGGDDFRSTIGYPATIFALPGQTLRGLTNPNGTPATQALVPSGQDGRSLKISDFAATAGQRAYYNQANLYSIITPTERWGLTLNAEYTLTKGLTLFSEFAHTKNYTDTRANPIGTNNPNGSATLPRIPATNPFNPFGQDLGYALSNDELGPRLLLTETKSLRALVGARAELPRGWQGEVSAMYYGQRLHALNGGLPSNAAFIAALNQTDPTKALNVFGDFYAKGPSNPPGLYESLVNTTIENSDSDVYTTEGTARGSLWRLPAGDIQLAVGGEWTQQDRLRTTNFPTTTLPARSREVRNNYAAYAEAWVPVFGKDNAKRLLHRLDLQIAARYENIQGAGQTADPRIALRWQPVKALLLRASYGTGYRAPALTELERPESFQNQTLIDRLRNNERYLMLVTSGSDPNLEPEISKTYNYGAILNVPGITGLSIGVDYYRKDVRNLSTSILPQTLLDFESSFADRIIRTASTGPVPGLVTLIDARFVNFGLVVTEGFDYSINYQRSTANWGRFTWRASATYLASYKIAFNPGDPLIERKGTFGFPQDLKGNTSVVWSRGNLGASLACYYNGAFDRNGRRVASFTTIDVGGSYEWPQRHLRFQGGLGNVFDRAPPFANTVWGYDGGFHSAKQRTYNTSVTYTF